MKTQPTEISSRSWMKVGWKMLFLKCWCDNPETAPDPVDGWGEAWADKVVDAFERLVSESSKKQLNEVKKREVNAIRRWVVEITSEF